MISVRGLCKTFDPYGAAYQAVKDVSFECRPGRVFGLLGPNGSGKTTTLRMLSTILKPTSGDAVTAGYSIYDNPAEVRRRIGFMSNSTGVYDRMTAREMVRYFGRLYGMEEGRLKARIDEIFTLLEMHDFGELLCAKMSSGMKQKVSIARTIVHDPPVLVFDEPTVALDILVQRVVTDFIRHQREQGKTILFSTHIMNEAETLCDDIAFIYSGRLLEQGELGAVKAAHGGDSIENIFFKLIDRERHATG